MSAWPLSQRRETGKSREQSRRRDLTARTAWTLGARGEDRQSVLAVREDSNVPEVPDREEVKEDLKTETDSVDLGEVVGAVTKGSAEVDTTEAGVVWEEDGSAGA